MNLRLIFSSAARDVCVMSDLRSVTTRLTTPGHEPCKRRPRQESARELEEEEEEQEEEREGNGP